MSKVKIKVLIVEDSVVVQKILSNILSKSDDIEVVGTALNPLIAREKIKELKPDVLTLDIEMPEMDGITFLGEIMSTSRMPVIMVSSLTETNSPKAIEALSLGAIDFVAKPKNPLEVEKISADLILKVKSAYNSKFNIKNEFSPTAPGNRKFKDNFVIAIGSSTGGIPVLENILKAMPLNCPPIIIVQHITASFAKSMVSRLNNICGIDVVDANNMTMVKNGRAYIASDDKHIELKKKNGNYILYTNDEGPVSMHKPSVDVMFRSVAEACGGNSVGAILTGMGSDGAKGLLEMKKSGAYTIGQNELSCVVYGMPRAAAAIGAVIEEVPMNQVAPNILDYITV